MSLRRWFDLAVVLMILLLLQSGSNLSPDNEYERVRAFTRTIEFDYIAWTLDALQIKLEQFSVDASAYLPGAERRKLVLDYLDLVSEIQQKEALQRDIYTDPEIQDPLVASQVVRAELDELYRKRSSLGPMAESVLQAQLQAIAADYGLTLVGQTLPPVLYHVTPLPMALIVSPRDTIRQDHNISLIPDLTIDQQVALETRVDQALNVSSLVVGIGGIGVYPTMVMQSSDLSWIAEVVAHEWVHNYLTLRPLGINYMTSPELRTMNETAASIAGIELGHALLERYYPERLPPPPALPPSPTQQPQAPQPPVFDFRAEMRTTRVTVDDLLAQGLVEQAEAYMEERRVFFWENGYHIRRLNQAYFAFYGAYADQPGGAAGEDPVGEAVRKLRSQSGSLAEFINRISWMWSFDTLQRAVERGE